MRIDEFNEETNNLERFFNKQLEDYERDIWFRELKYMPSTRYKQIIKKIYTESKFMPKLADIISLSRELPYEQKQETKVECDICKGKGYLFYTQKKNGHLYDFVARCDCKNGENYKYDDGKWYIPSVNQLGL